MKILFSVYFEDHETDENELLYTRTVETNLKIEEIDTLLQIYDGFHSVLEVGRNLCFWDIYCFFANIDDLKEKISSIPAHTSEIKDYVLPEIIVIKCFNPGNSGSEFYPDDENCFAYRIVRYECGASGFESIVMFAADHPWLMVFIGGAIWDFTKYLWNKLMKLFKKRNSVVNKRNSHEKTVCFSVKKCYQSFFEMTKIPYEDCQIVFLKRTKNNIFDVRIRTINNECFNMKCTRKGKITSMKPVDVKTLPKI